MAYPPETMKLTDLDVGVYSKIAESLSPKWRDFVKILTERRFQLSKMEVEKIAHVLHQPGLWNCAEKLMEKLSERGMLVKHLIKYLRKLHLYAALKFLVPPEPVQLVYQSKDVSVEAGKEVVLVCQASAIPPPCYTWYKEMEVIISSPNPEFKISNTELHEAGSYICGVTREGIEGEEPVWGRYIQVEILSAPYRLPPKATEDSLRNQFGSMSVTQQHLPPPPPLYAPRIVSQTGVAGGLRLSKEYGDKLELECQATGEPAPDFVWLKDDVVLEGQTGNILSIPSVTGHHNGTYKCSVFNSQGEASSYKVHVTILGQGDGKRLKITQHPGDKDVEAGGVVQFEVEASGSGLTYQWYKSGNMIQGATLRHYQINNINADHRGKYQCLVAAHDDHNRLIESKLSEEGVLTVKTRGDKPSKVVGKVALVIGVSPEFGTNDKKLMCVINDCILIKQKLRELDFKVMSFYKLTKHEMTCAVEIFANFLGEGVYGVVYLAGHGMLCAGQHYLSPVDPREGNFLEDHYCVEEMQRTLLQRQPKLLAMFLDMCRTEFGGPIQEIHQAAVKPVNDRKENFFAENGNLIVFYATLPYRQALEPNVPGTENLNELAMPIKNPSKNGILCELLSKVMHRDIPLDQMFRDIQDALQESDSWKLMCEWEAPAIPNVYNGLKDWRCRLTDPLTRLQPQIDKWEKISVVPQTQNMFIRKHGLSIEVSFCELLSTVIQVTIKPHKQWPFREVAVIRICTERLDNVLHIAQERMQYEDGKLFGSVAVISHLHRIKDPITLTLELHYPNQSHEDENLQKIIIPYALMSTSAANFICKDLEGRACHKAGVHHADVQGGCGDALGDLGAGGAVGGAVRHAQGQEHNEYSTRGEVIEETQK